jgi:hypothetical protein
MPCTNPLSGFLGKNGKIVFSNENKNCVIPLQPMEVSCGQCTSCRLQRSKEWAIRLVKEARDWPSNECLFLTLTYNDENLPKDGSVHKEHFQKFIKDIRYYVAIKKYDVLRKKYHVQHKKIKYFHCGEYGLECSTCGKSKHMHDIRKACDNYAEQLGRPHYHCILYGVSFKDMELHSVTKAGSKIYKSKQLDDIWGRGFCSIGEVTFESCAYTARYIMKKINGQLQESHYKKL